jgi:hypothetical protein
MYVNRADIVATLRLKGLPERADWVDRTLPDLVDTRRNSSLLQTLGVDPAALSGAKVAAQQD